MRRTVAVILIIIVSVVGSSLYITYSRSLWQQLHTVRELKIAIPTDITTLDINYAIGVSDFEVLGKVYESLFRIDYDSAAKKLIYRKWLVEDYRRISDTEWLFILRSGVKFHNGEELTSWDVKASIERALKVSPIGKMLLRDARGEPIIEDVVVHNRTAFTVRLRGPFTPLIEHLAHLAIAVIPRSVAERYRDSRIGNASDAVGTGPYRLLEYVRGQYVKLQRFSGYWRGEPRIKNLTYMIIPDASTRMSAIEAGQVDIAVGIAPEMVSRLEGRGVKIHSETGVRLVIAAINVQRVPDVRIRCAMNYAVDRKAVVDRMMGGFAVVAQSIVSPVFPGYAQLESYAYDPEMAKRLIREAGGVPRKLTLLVSTRSPKDVELAQVLQNYLSVVGVDVEIQTMEHTAFLKRVFTDHDFDLAIYGPSPSSLYYGLTYWRSGAALNAPLYSNSEVDALLDEAARESSVERQYELYRRVQEIVWRDCPAVWMYYENIIVAVKPGVEGLKILPFQMLVLDEVFTRS